VTFGVEVGVGDGSGDGAGEGLGSAEAGAGEPQAESSIVIMNSITIRKDKTELLFTFYFSYILIPAWRFRNGTIARL